MKTNEQLGTFAAILEGSPDNIRRIAVALRSLIGRIHPASVETPRSGERCTTYGIGPRKMTEAYARIGPFRDHVGLGFYHGTQIADPKGLLEGTGKSSRHVKVRDIGQVRDPAIRALIVAAIAERRAAAARRAS